MKSRYGRPEVIGALVRLAPSSESLARRLIVNSLLVVAAYFVATKFVFPGFIALPAAFHPDLYGASEGTVHGFPFSAVMHGPRPLGSFIALVAGEGGFETAMVENIAFSLAGLALSMTLCELVLQRTIPWWIAFATFVLAVAAPAFAFNAGYDPGNVATFFGLLGMVVWESRRPAAWAYVAALALFVASALVKESFVPVLFVYAVAVAVRDARTQGTRVLATVALPCFAAAATLIDAGIVQTPFILPAASHPGPYTANFSPVSIVASLRFYVSPLTNAPFIALFCCCLVGIWLHERLRVAAVVVLAVLALYLPYTVLPNHLLGYYFWVPWPVLMLLVPLAWTPEAAPGIAPVR